MASEQGTVDYICGQMRLAGFDGAAYDADWPARAAQTLWVDPSP